MITLEITRREKNPKYNPPKDYNGIYHQSYDIPEYSTYDVLKVEITEEQFQAIRKEVLANF